MKIMGSFTSPFVRRVRVVAIEKGLRDQIEFVETDPFSDQADFLAANPLSKVPVLLGSSIGTLYDSRVIAEYLNSLATTPALLPQSGNERWNCLKLQALAEGVMDAAAASVMEARRSDGMISSHWQQRRAAAMRRGAGALQSAVAGEELPLNLGGIAAATALAYLDFRHPEVAWRDTNPSLATATDRFCERPSMLATQPPSA